MSKKLSDLVSHLTSSSREHELVEFKHNFHSAEEIGQDLSALANSACLHNTEQAYLVFGVENVTHKIIGTTFKPYTKKAKGNEDLIPWLTGKLNPKLAFKVDVTTMESGLEVVVFTVPAALGSPVTFDNVSYIRIDSYTKRLSEYPNEQAKIWRKQASDWSAVICDGATIADLSPEALATARILFTAKNPNLADAIALWDDVTFLNKAKLSINGKLTRTAILLLGLPESEHYLSPANPTITWILKDALNKEKDYQHFSLPWLLAVSEVYAKVRNLKYRYIPEGSLFPDEVDQYDPYIIREALNNCIAHQDYTLGGKIVLVETEDATLTFLNSGEFIPSSVEYVIETDAPEQKYRNKHLCNAMVNLNMIDTIGSGIKRMFDIQRKKFFPLPEYNIQNHKVQVQIIGKLLDIAYARKLAQMPDLTLSQIILLDKIQKHQPIDTNDLAELRKKGLVEGRKNSLSISSTVAKQTNLRKNYLELRGLDDNHYKSQLVAYIDKFSPTKRADIEAYLLDKLPQVLDENQKRNKIKNLLQAIKKEGLVKVSGKTWISINP